nr:unnamed protein product [Callosobruchus analis]
MLVDYGTAGYYPTKIFKSRYLRSLPRIQRSHHKGGTESILIRVNR